MIIPTVDWSAVESLEYTGYVSFGRAGRLFSLVFLVPQTGDRKIYENLSKAFEFVMPPWIGDHDTNCSGSGRSAERVRKALPNKL